jgi:hypothetical protein
MDIASVFEWFAQESISIAEQAAEPEQREKLAELALLWASAAQQCSGGARPRRRAGGRHEAVAPYAQPARKTAPPSSPAG